MLRLLLLTLCTFCVYVSAQTKTPSFRPTRKPTAKPTATLSCIDSKINVLYYLGALNRQVVGTVGGLVVPYPGVSGAVRLKFTENDTTYGIPGLIPPPVLLADYTIMDMVISQVKNCKLVPRWTETIFTCPPPRDWLVDEGAIGIGFTAAKPFYPWAKDLILDYRLRAVFPRAGCQLQPYDATKCNLFYMGVDQLEQIRQNPPQSLVTYCKGK